MANVVTMAPRRKALASIKTGVLDTPLRVLIYGAEKVGKSTFAAGAPSPVFLGAENGTERLDVARMQPENWAEAVSFVHDIATEKHDFKTIVVDPLGWLEPMCWAAVTNGAGSIEDFGGGYGKGYLAALSHWREFLAALEKCWKRGMHVVLVGHAQVKPFQNPEGLPYDRYELVLNAKAAGLFRQWVDIVAFTRLEISTKKEKGDNRAKAIFTGMRLVHTSPCAAYDAGSRWKIPEELPLGWDQLFEAVRAEGDRPAELLKRVHEQAEELADEKVTAFVANFIKQHGSNADRLAELSNRLAVKLDSRPQVQP